MSLYKIVRELVESKREKQSKYKKFKQAVLAFYGVNSPDELDSAKKKQFYKYIDSQWKRFKMSLKDTDESSQVNEKVSVSENINLKKDIGFKTLEEFLNESYKNTNGSLNEIKLKQNIELQSLEDFLSSHNIDVDGEESESDDLFEADSNDTKKEYSNFLGVGPSVATGTGVPLTDEEIGDKLEMGLKIRSKVDKKPGESDTKYIERVSGVKRGDKEKAVEYKKRVYNILKTKYPYVHKDAVPIIDSATGKKYNLDALRKSIKIRPNELLKKNEKIKHSGGVDEQYYNLGVPALRGLIIDETDGDKFKIIDTCPMAGQCMKVCFAMKGGYVQWVGAFLKQTRTLNFLLNDPSGFKNKLEDEIRSNLKSNKNVQMIIRWHDSGDFFSDEYKRLVYSVANKFPQVQFYAYTKMDSVVNDPNLPKNFIINFSTNANTVSLNRVDFKKTKYAIVVEKEIFEDLVRREYSYKNSDKLKSKLSVDYGIDIDTIKTYDELKSTPIENNQKWNVMVKGDDIDYDVISSRKDILRNYLLCGKKLYSGDISKLKNVIEVKFDKSDMRDKYIKSKLLYKDDESINVLKDRLVAEYSSEKYKGKFELRKDTFLTYDEMKKIPKGTEMKWNVIVKSGDGDDSANRRDVLGTYLLIH